MTEPRPTPPPAPRGVSLPDLAVALGVVLLGVLLLIGTQGIQSTGMYTAVGPRTFPLIISLGTVLVGTLLTWGVVRGDRAEPAAEEDTDPDAPVNHVNPVFILAGFLLGSALLAPLGFVIGTTVMYGSVAYAFGERRYGLVALIALIVAILTFEVFTRGLGLTLPPGVLRGVL